MSRDLKTLFQRHTDGQQVHEKMFNITNHHGIQIKTNELSPHTCQNDYCKKDRQQKMLVSMRDGWMASLTQWR